MVESQAFVKVYLVAVKQIGEVSLQTDEQVCVGHVAQGGIGLQIAVDISHLHINGAGGDGFLVLAVETHEIFDILFSGFRKVKFGNFVQVSHSFITVFFHYDTHKIIIVVDFITRQVYSGDLFRQLGEIEVRAVTIVRQIHFGQVGQYAQFGKRVGGDVRARKVEGGGIVGLVVEQQLAIFIKLVSLLGKDGFQFRVLYGGGAV